MSLPLVSVWFILYLVGVLLVILKFLKSPFGCSWFPILCCLYFFFSCVVVGVWENASLGIAVREEIAFVFGGIFQMNYVFISISSSKVLVCLGGVCVPCSLDDFSSFLTKSLLMY